MQKKSNNDPKLPQIAQNYPKLKGYLSNYIFHTVEGRAKIRNNARARVYITQQHPVSPEMVNPIHQVLNILDEFYLEKFFREMKVKVRLYLLLHT